MEEHLCLRQNPRAGQWEMGEWPGPSESAADGCRSDGVAREISGLKRIFPQDSSKTPFLFRLNIWTENTPSGKPKQCATTST